MKKKVLCLAVLSVIMLGSVASCGGNNSSSSSSATPTSSASSSSSSTSTASHAVTISISGATDNKYAVGGTIEVSVKLDGAFATTGASLTASNDNVTIGEGIAGLYSVDLVKAGEVTFTAKVSVDGQEYSATETITITDIEVTSIADAKKLDDGTSVTVRGKVTAICGSSAYIADSTGGIYIYNWSYNNNDTAITNKTWTLGQTVEVKANVAYFNAKQLSNYNSSSKSRIEGTYAKTTTASITYTPIELDQTSYSKLTTNDVGNVYSFTATYVSGTPVYGEKGTNSNVNFKIGTKNVVFKTDGYDKVGVSTTLVPNRKYKVTTVLYSKTQFKLCYGTQLVEQDVKNPTALSISAEKSSVEVGSTTELSATFTPNDASAIVTYSITEGSENATISGTTLTGVKTGTVKVVGSVTIDGTTITSDPITITIEVPQTASKINTITGEGDYFVKGVVAATCKQGYIVADDTAAIYVHVYSSGTIQTIGTYVSIKGTASLFKGQLQFTTPTVTKITDTSDKPTLADAIDLTSSIADSLKTSTSVTDKKLYKWTTTVAKSGDYYTFNVADSSTVIEAQYTTFTVSEGTTYDVEGYFAGYNTGYGYANFIFTKVSAQTSN